MTYGCIRFHADASPTGTGKKTPGGAGKSITPRRDTHANRYCTFVLFPHSSEPPRPRCVAEWDRSDAIGKSAVRTC
jgi:hypothetical protein